MRKTKLAASLLAVSLAATTLLTGCDKNPASSGSNSGTTPGTSNSGSDSSGTTVETPALELTYAGGTELRMATGYNSADTGMFFSAKIAGEGVTLADGKTYNTGDLKPTWVEVQNKLNVKFTDMYQGNSSQNEFNHHKEKLNEVDMVSGTVALLTEYGKIGEIVNLTNYLDAMPNFKAYLEANPIVRLSITGSVTNDASKGAIYFSPYFDGVNDIEKMPLMRTDWVEKLLNGEGKFEAAASGTTATPVYKPYMPTTGTVSVTVVKKDGSGTEEITKDYSKYGNIIEKMNASMSGVEAVNMLRDYIDATYGGYYGTNRADLFIGQNAAWDADELVALLRCVCANSQTLNGTDTINGLFSREEGNHARRADVYRLAGVLFGARGMESRQEWLYIGSDGKLVDARTQDATYEALERMNAMAQEGLIAKDFLASNADGKTETYLKNDNGFMHYDYNQTQTVYNESGALQEGEKYMAVMVPVAKWDDGDATTPDYMRFTESWRSVKTDGWGISMAGVGLTEDKKVTTQAEIDALPDKLKACLKIIDYAYSAEGQVLMSYGPAAFRGTETFNFNGEEWPVIADATRTELWDKAKGNYTNYARQYLGSTLSFAKSQAFEYQCTTAVGREGAGYISKAIALGTIKHPMLSIESNPWWTSMPTVLPVDAEDQTQINTFVELGVDKFSATKGKGANIYTDLIINGYASDFVPGANRAEVINTIKTTWKADAALALREKAWQRLVKFYESLNA